MKITNKSVVALLAVAVVSGGLMFGYGWFTPNNQTPPQLEAQTVSAPLNKDLIIKQIGQVPLAFEANQGQAAAATKFVSRNAQHSLLINQTETVLTLGSPKTDESAAPTVLRMHLENSDPTAAIEGVDARQTKNNYYLGANSKKWSQDVATFSKVRRKAVYTGIDAVYYGTQQQLEYDFVVAPQADPNQIKIRFDNADKTEIDDTGNLLISAAGQTIRQHAPVLYQETAGVRRSINGRYVQNDDQTIGFEISDYDKQQELVIDPVIVFSTLLGGTSQESPFGPQTEAIWGVDTDSAGNVYVVGMTIAFDFPTRDPKYAKNGVFDGFISKFNPTGTELLYSTYFGGSDDDRIFQAKVDSAGQVYVAGITTSTDLPLVTPLQQSNKGLIDGFVARFDQTGKLNYSTYFGGTNQEIVTFLQVDNAGMVYFGGNTFSNDLPTANAVQPQFGGSIDLFAVKLDPVQNKLIYSTYFGGPFDETTSSFQSGVIGRDGSLYLSGTGNRGTPTTKNAFQPKGAGSADAVVVKLSPTGSLVYSTLLGGAGSDGAYSIAVDNDGNAVVTGISNSNDFPTRNAAQATLHGQIDTFVAKLNADGSDLIFSTYWGGSVPRQYELDIGAAIAVDSTGNIYVTGSTQTSDFPLINPVGDRPNPNSEDAILVKFNPAGKVLLSTAFGGDAGDEGTAIKVDNNENVIIVGYARRGFPTTKLAFQRELRGDLDGFVTKINTQTNPTTTPTRAKPFDFDGDGRTDFAVFRPTNAVWYLLNSRDGFAAAQFGLQQDVIVPADYDGDGKTDVATWRPSEGNWYVQQSRAGFAAAKWGQAGDIPVPADYDNDGRSDFAIWRPADGVWYVSRSTGGQTYFQFGQSGDKPVPADYDGDGRADFAVYRNGTWYVQQSTNGFTALQFGLPTDIPVVADYDGDGKADFAVFRPSNGVWYRLNSASDNSFSAAQFGLPTDLPLIGDYDGDGKADLAVFRPETGTTFVQGSTAGFSAAQFGSQGDRPIGNAFLR